LLGQRPKGKTEYQSKTTQDAYNEKKIQVEALFFCQKEKNQAKTPTSTLLSKGKRIKTQLFLIKRQYLNTPQNTFFSRKMHFFSQKVWSIRNNSYLCIAFEKRSYHKR